MEIARRNSISGNEDEDGDFHYGRALSNFYTYYLPFLVLAFLNLTFCFQVWPMLEQHDRFNLTYTGRNHWNMHGLETMRLVYFHTRFHCLTVFLCFYSPLSLCTIFLFSFIYRYRCRLAKCSADKPRVRHPRRASTLRRIQLLHLGGSQAHQHIHWYSESSQHNEQIHD